MSRISASLRTAALRTPTRTAAVALLAAAGLALAACGGPSPDSVVSPQAGAASSMTSSMTQSAAEGPASTATDGDTGGAVTGEPAPGVPDSESAASQDHASVPDSRSSKPSATDSSGSGPLAGLVVTPEQAAATAIKQVSGARVTAVELERSHGVTVWEVDLVTDTAKHEIAVDAVSGDVVGNETESGKDLTKYRHRLDQVQVGYRDAIAAAVESKPGSQVVEIELDDEHGTVVWEMDVITAEHQKFDIEVDVTNGKIVRSQPND